MAPDRLDQQWSGENDHDRLTRQEQVLFNVLERLEKVEDRVDLLMSDRAKLIGICAGVSGAVAIVVKLFWPSHG